MKNAKVFKNDIIHKPELTAFVREVVLPGCAGAMPNLDSPLCFFQDWQEINQQITSITC